MGAGSVLIFASQMNTSEPVVNFRGLSARVEDEQLPQRGKFASKSTLWSTEKQLMAD